MFSRFFPSLAKTFLAERVISAQCFIPGNIILWTKTRITASLLFHTFFPTAHSTINLMFDRVFVSCLLPLFFSLVQVHSQFFLGSENVLVSSRRTYLGARLLFWLLYVHPEWLRALTFWWLNQLTLFKLFERIHWLFFVFCK